MVRRPVLAFCSRTWLSKDFCVCWRGCAFVESPPESGQWLVGCPVPAVLQPSGLGCFVQLPHAAQFGIEFSCELTCNFLRHARQPL
mmetsp:Transcript_50075/g.109524  ORF Transcript_50075/g.109524 Transcript_50075/m.109524 type:complete len:86 (+) Transcript_50075:2036-2293(+)